MNTGPAPGQMETLFHAFEHSPDTLRVYDANRLFFSSVKGRLEPLLDYLATKARPVSVVIFDRIAGNAAALLAIKAGARSLWSPLGSRIALRTLAEAGVEANFMTEVDVILRPGSQEMCPMEKLSLGQAPDSLYHLLTSGKGHKTPA